MRKTSSMVEPAIRSSMLQEEGWYQGVEGSPAPKEDRPSARRKTWSMCAKAAVVAGEDSGSEVSDVEVAWSGGGMCIVMDMW